MNEERKKRIIGILAVVTVAFMAWFVWHTIQMYQKKIRIEEDLKLSAFQTVAPAAAGDAVIIFEGREYERHPSIKAFLLIGVDSSGELEQKVSGGGGQADGVFLIAYDAAKNAIKVMMIPRDTMTPIILTDLSGNILGKDVQHLTLAYGYGDGRELSCERMAEAVSELLGGLDIDGYLAMNTSMVAELNDMAGGVTVRIETDDMERRDPDLVKGSEVTLTGEQAEAFVRYRDIEIDHSAITRMSRQKQYMEGYFVAVKRQAAADDQTIVRLMNLIEGYMITNLSKDQYLNIGKAVLYSGEAFGGDDIVTLPGETVVARYFDEFHHDPVETERMVLELFYREK